VQLVNESLMIRDGNVVVRIADGTSLYKYDIDTVLLQFATDRLA